MKPIYQKPTIEVVEIEVEKGFAVSGSTSNLTEGEGTWGNSLLSNSWNNH